jgi:toxin CcdB
MAQFDCHLNRNPRSHGTYPYLLDIQATLLEHLRTRVVVPLAPVAHTEVLQHLTPIVEIDDERYLVMTSQLAGIDSLELGEVNATSVITARRSLQRSTSW